MSWISLLFFPWKSKRHNPIQRNITTVAVARLYSEKKNRPIEAHRPTLSKQELESVLDCLINDRLGSGDIVRKFERSFASAFGYKHALAVNSLTAAYHLAFLALDLGAEDTVVMSSLAPVAACDAARYTGAKIRLVDVDRDSFHPSQEKVREVLDACEESDGKRPSLFVLDHTFGSVSPLDPEAIRAGGTRIVEDFTGLVGSDQEGSCFGNTGTISVCGLAETDLITTGNGAVAVSSDPKVHHRLSQLRYNAKRSPGSLAYDYRLEDFQAAMGLDQLSRLGITLARRKKIGIKYLETLRLTSHSTYFSRPQVDCYLKFPVVVNKNRDEVRRYFASLQIGVTDAMEFPLHHLLQLPRMEFPNAERLYQKGVAIPVYPSLTANNVERICSSLRGLM